MSNKLSYWWLVCLVLAGVSVALAANGAFRSTPHGSPTSGVLRTSEYPQGSCAQCHSAHDNGAPQPFGLFRENSNDLCFSASQGGCHADQPAGASAGYPAQESDRMPAGSTDPGYFEYGNGGVRIPGLANLVRWPGKTTWENPLSSPHYNDPDMPIKDVYGYGSCDNCHDVHGGSGQHDLLDTTWLGINGSQNGPLPDNYALCLSCHSITGPAGMNEASRNIAYYYDRSINPGTRGGHGISDGGGYVPSGSRLPCSDCHNPHGSVGYGNGGANGFLISDQRPGWYGLTDIVNDADQVRRFCFGCHISSDGEFGGAVEGLTLQPLSSELGAHRSTARAHCYTCHGNDYSSPTSYNVHNPNPGHQ